MPAAQIKSLEFVGQDGLRAGLEDGGQSTFRVAAPGQTKEWVEANDFSFGSPVLFLRRVDEITAAVAAQAMAADMGGYWLRYYNTPETPAKKKAAKAGRCKVVSAVVSELYPPRSQDDGCAVVQARIDDSREFSLLTATPSWFERAFRDNGLAYYFGPSILFVRRLEPKLVRRAVDAMAAQGDELLCRYDTPRRTLPEVLADFKTRHPEEPAV